jgi:predicted aspartyl protease
MLKNKIIALAAAVLFVLPAVAASPVIAAAEADDIVALDALTANAATADERTLAQGSAQALRHKDTAALAMLEPLAKRATDKEVAVAAYLAAGAVYLRQGRFADVCRTSEAAEALRAAPLDHEQRQTLDFAKVLTEVTPMAVKRKASGGLAVTRDVAGLARIPLTVNGVAIDVVVDSGAGFSTLTESTAKKLGVMPLARTTSVASASKDDVPIRLGIGKELKFGDAVLTDVVFIILPDSALTFAEGRYKIDAIVGLPVFEALGRIELAREGDKEVLRYGSRPGAPALGNMILDGVQPIVLAEAGDARLRLFVDTGATNTTLNGSAARDFPGLTKGGVKAATKIAGAGGVSDDPDAVMLPSLHLTVAGRSFDLADVLVRSKIVASHHGDIGQDVLNQGKRWSLDFENMSFAVED